MSETEFTLLQRNGNVRVAANSVHRSYDQPTTNTVAPTKPEKRPQGKYGNRKVEYDGDKFDSKRELARWHQLKMMEISGQISELKRQVPFELVPSVQLDGKKQRPVVYIADFTYIEHPGYMTVEDSKGFKTPDYIIKRKLMKHVHGIEVLET